MESQSETTQTVSALKLPVIINGDSVSSIASASAEGPIPPKTSKQNLARKNELKTKSTLMLAIPDEHLLKFHACKDAKSLWEEIKNRFGGNKESKKTQKTILKQNYKNFAASSQKGLDKTYDSTNETVNTAHSVFAASSKNQVSTASYADDIDTNDLEEMDLKLQVAMLTMRVKRFIKKTIKKLDLNGKDTVGFDKTKVECYNCHRICHFARECRAPRNQGNRNRDAPTRNVPVHTSTTNALVVQDGIDSEVHTCSKECLKSFEALQKQYDQQRKALNKSNLVIIGYQIGLESLEARIAIHEKNEAVYEEDIVFLKYDVQIKDISIKDLKNQLENALKEKEGLKLKLKKFETSSKNLTKLINSQISAINKTSLGYDSHVNESEVLNNVVDSCESDGDDNQEKITGPKEIRPVWNNIARVNHQNKLTHPHPKRSLIPAVVLTKSGQVPINIAKQSSQRAATSVSAARPFNKKSTAKTNNFIEKVNTAKINNVTTDGPKAVVSATEGNRNNVVNSSACWMWRPKGNLIDHISKDSGSYILKRFNYVDPQGRFNFVAFGGNAKGGKITGKGKTRTGKLDFEDVYFMKELKFNIFSVSQMFDKKNSALFSNTKCVVLSPDFKLLDESQVLLKVPRNNNMYSFDLKNVVPVGGLTCLFTKATLDESNLWHRRLGHINFKTMHKVMRRNLVRGLPSKLFENDHTCVGFQKGKQHKASYGISDEFGVKTGSCKVNAARLPLLLLVTVRDNTAEGVSCDLHFNDEDGITCLSNDEIFENLALMGQAKRGWDTEIPQSSGPSKKVGDETVYTGEDDRVVRDATNATSLEAEHEKVNTTGSEEDSMAHPDDLTYFVPPTPHDSPLSGGHTPGSDEDLVIKKLQKKVKRLEKKQRVRTSGMNLFKIGTLRRKSLDKENVSKHGRNLKTRIEEGDFDDDFNDIDDMVDKAMKNVKGDTFNAAIGVSVASTSVTTNGVSIKTVEPRTPLTTTTKAFENEDLTIAQTLVKIRSEKAKEKGVVFSNVEESARPKTILPIINPKDKGKGIMQELEKPPKNSRKAQI
nr:ribonuclease H-like domain-containing protein [Tanacetum cinerariifolium]